MLGEQRDLPVPHTNWSEVPGTYRRGPSSAQHLAYAGDFGILEGFVMDEASWHLSYLDVKSGSWLQNRSILVPTRWVQSVSWADFRVNLHHTKTGI